MSRRLLASYLSLALVVLVALEVPLGIAYARNQRSSTTTRLERDAVAVGSFAEDALQSGGNTDPLRALARRYADENDAGVVVVDRSGATVVQAAEEGPYRGSRLGLTGALAGRVATGTTGGTLYVAVPVASGGVVHGAVRIAIPLADLDRRIRNYALRLLAIAAGVLVVVAIVGRLLARSVSRPLGSLARTAQQTGQGDLGARANADAGPQEVREVARSFNDMVARLGELLGAQEAFVADASHQLRTPLTALRLRLENGDVEGGLRETDRLARLVDGLLALARAEAAPAEPLSLPTLLRERLAAWQPVADEREVGLESDATGTALASSDRLGQVLDNLLANALAAAPRGSTITITGDDRALHVRDHGPGMTDEDRERAFDRFWSKGSGSGLGLPIARRLLAVDGGTIELRPANGGGLDVVLRLRHASERDERRPAQTRVDRERVPNA